MFLSLSQPFVYTAFSVPGHSLEGPISTMLITYVLGVLSVDLCFMYQFLTHYCQATIVLIFINDDTEVKETKELVPCHNPSNMSSCNRIHEDVVPKDIEFMLHRLSVEE